MSEDSRPCQKPLVVLPTFNECDNLASMVSAVRTQLPAATIWIVDDNSPDGTGHLADELAAGDALVEVIHRPEKLGLGTAYIEAFRRALGQDFDCIVQMDADFSHDPRYLPSLLGNIKDADLVIGSRYVRGGGTQNWSLARRFISKGGNVVARIGLGVRVHDATGGYRAYRRTTLEQLHFDDLKLRGYGFQIEVAFQVERRGLRIKEIPIVFVERIAGRSKMSRQIAFEAFTHILKRRMGMLRRLPEPAPDAKPTAISHQPSADA
jgi:dolichol-phosphate mannosyltransferase